MNKFNQSKYQNEWTKENMKAVTARFKNDFVDEFKEACAVLGLSQSEVIREMMQNIITKARQIKAKKPTSKLMK